MGTHLRVLSKSFPVNTNKLKMVFNIFCTLLLRTKVALALEGLNF